MVKVAIHNSNGETAKASGLASVINGWSGFTATVLNEAPEPAGGDNTYDVAIWLPYFWTGWWDAAWRDWSGSVLSIHPSVNDEMGLIGAADTGAGTNENTHTVRAGASHPILTDAGLVAGDSIGYTGNRKPLTGPFPASAADLVHGSNTGHSRLFVVEAGATLLNGNTAGGRRAAMSGYDLSTQHADYLGLLKSTLSYLAGDLDSVAIATSAPYLWFPSWAGGSGLVPDPTIEGGDFSLGGLSSWAAGPVNTSHNIGGSAGDFHSGLAPNAGGFTSTDRPNIVGGLFAAEAGLSLGPNGFVAEWVVPEERRGFAVTGSASDDLRRTLREGGEYHSVIELLSPTESVLYSSDPRRSDESVRSWVPHAGAFVYQRDATVQRSVDLTLPADSIDLAEAVSPIHPFRAGGNLVRIWAGYRNTIGDDEMFPLGTLLIASGEVSDEGGMTGLNLSCLSRLSLLATGFQTAFTIEAGTNNVDAVKSILETVYPVDSASFDLLYGSTKWVTPHIDVEIGAVKRELVDKLLDAIGWEISDDPRGRLYLQPIAETYIDPGAEAEEVYGDGGVPANSVSLGWGGAAPIAGVAVEGGSLSDDGDPVQISVWDQDPQSETFLDPAARDLARLATMQNDFVLSTRQGIEAGYGQLRRIGRGGRELTFQAAPNPSLREGSVIEFCYSKFGLDPEKYRIERVSIPPDADGSFMDVTIRGSWFPPGPTGLPVVSDPEPPVASISDNFDRPDGNLDGQATNWTESGWSFNLRGGRAVDLNGDNVVAWWQEPLQTTDHWSQVYVDALLRAGDHAGPACRISGSGNGYALVGNNVGLVNLLRLVDRIPVETLGTWNKGSTVVGSTLRIEALGNTIRGLVDGVERISVTNSALPAGLLVGMKSLQGLGQSGTLGLQSPALDDFLAGAL